MLSRGNTCACPALTCDFPTSLRVSFSFDQSICTLRHGKAMGRACQSPFVRFWLGNWASLDVAFVSRSCHVCSSRLVQDANTKANSVLSANSCLGQGFWWMQVSTLLNIAFWTLVSHRMSRVGTNNTLCTHWIPECHKMQLAHQLMSMAQTAATLQMDVH